MVELFQYRLEWILNDWNSLRPIAHTSKIWFFNQYWPFANEDNWYTRKHAIFIASKSDSIEFIFAFSAPSQISDLLIFLIQQPISERKKKLSILDKNSFTIWGFFQRNLARQIISIMKVIMRAFSFKIMVKLELSVAQTVETNILEFGINYFVYMSNFEVPICLNSQYI